MKKGHIEVIYGCMFSGKTEALIARIEDLRRVGRQVAAFKHASDNRYDPRDIVSHGAKRTTAQPVEHAAEVVAPSQDADVVAIDEAQHFDDDLPDVVQHLADAGKHVILAGLDLDSWGLPFEPVPTLIAMADEATQLFGHCRVCGKRADHTQRIAPIANTMIGGPGEFEARCAEHFAAPPIELRQ